MRKRMGNGHGARLSETLNGPTNPTWVEWLMGFPMGWTDVPPSGMPSSHRRRKRSADS
jgi:hypothetical protein